MTNISEPGDRGTVHSGLHSHSHELTMHWMDVCTDSTAQTATVESTIAANPLAHHDQLVAVWTEEGATVPRTTG